MPLVSCRRVSLLLILGLVGAVVLGGAPVVRCGPEEPAPPESIVTGRVVGLAKGQDARVEVRRLGAEVDRLDDLPDCGEADSRDRAPWLTSGAAAGEALRVLPVEGPDATYRIEGLRAGTYELGLVCDGKVVWRTPAVLEVDGQHVEADVSVPTGSLHLRAGRLRVLRSGARVHER